MDDHRFDRLAEKHGHGVLQTTGAQDARGGHRSVAGLGATRQAGLADHQQAGIRVICSPTSTVTAPARQPGARSTVRPTRASPEPHAPVQWSTQAAARMHVLLRGGRVSLQRRQRLHRERCLRRCWTLRRTAGVLRGQRLHDRHLRSCHRWLSLRGRHVLRPGRLPYRRLLRSGERLRLRREGLQCPRWAVQRRRVRSRDRQLPGGASAHRAIVRWRRSLHPGHDLPDGRHLRRRRTGGLPGVRHVSCGRHL